jgi:hypothetical protein
LDVALCEGSDLSADSSWIAERDQPPLCSAEVALVGIVLGDQQDILFSLRWVERIGRDVRILHRPQCPADKQAKATTCAKAQDQRENQDPSPRAAPPRAAGHELSSAER